MLPEHIIQTTIIKGTGPFIDARESKRKVRYVVMKQVSEDVTEDEPAVSAHHVAAIIQRNGGHFSGWDVYNYLGHTGDSQPKCAERLPANLRIMRYADYVKTEQERLSQLTDSIPEPEGV
eukprot:COSAG02_NODE_3421_length_6773_cov_2.734043_2_plen_120_part_00